MKTHLKLIAVLFLAGFALLGQSCAEEEFPPRPGPAFPADVTNRYALLLQEQLQADGAAYDRYTEVLSDRTPSMMKCASPPTRLTVYATSSRIAPRPVRPSKVPFTFLPELLAQKTARSPSTAPSEHP